MTDFHCHILPGIDDGARDVETSIELLRMEKEQGVDKMIFTPHFRCDDISLDDFLRARENAYKTLIKNLPDDLKEHFTFKLGAEVYFSPTLSKIDLLKLCFEGTSYMLVELPFTSDIRPAFLDEILYTISSRGITPIIAHVERYPYILSDPTQIYDWVIAGYLVQTNAKTVVDGDKMVKKLMSWGLVQLVASDTHSLHRRPPMMSDAYAALKPEIVSWFKQNGDDIFENYEINVGEPHYPKKVLGSWK